MSTRSNGVNCWYCNSSPNEWCDACEEVNEILAPVPEGVSIERLTKVFEAVHDPRITAGSASRSVKNTIAYLRGIR